MPPRLETPRLLLRPFVDQDASAAYQIFETHPDVYHYDPGFRRTSQQRERLIQQYAYENDLNGVGTLAVTLKPCGPSDTCRLIGYAGLQLYLLPREPFASPEVELFYKLGRDYWGKGYAIEACRAVLDYAFQTLRLARTVSSVARENERSIRLLERLGARIEDAPPAWPNYRIGTIEQAEYLRRKCDE